MWEPKVANTYKEIMVCEKYDCWLMHLWRRKFGTSCFEEFINDFNKTLQASLIHLWRFVYEEINIFTFKNCSSDIGKKLHCLPLFGWEQSSQASVIQNA